MMDQVSIIGCGSHAEVVYSILVEKYSKVVFLSTGKYQPPTSFPYLSLYAGCLNDYPQDGQFILAVGDNTFRKELALKYPHLNYVNAVSARSYISPNAQIGKGNVICPGVVIQTGTIIGDHCILNTNCSVDHHNDLRSFVHLAPSCATCGHVTIHEGGFLGVGSSVVPQVTLRPWFSCKAHTLIKTSNSPIPIAQPHLGSLSFAHQALDSGWISSQGEYIKKATDLLKETLNVPYAILVSNGTTATHCLFMALKFFHPEVKKIYCPDNVYVAVWNTALYEYPPGALEILPTDPQTLNAVLDVENFEPNSAVVIVHNLGNVVNVPELKRKRPDLIFLEDNCEGLFGKYGDLYTGTFSGTLCSSVSFFGNKTITCGEGGAFLTCHKEVYDFIARRINQGNTAVRYVHDTLGYNYRITNIQTAILYDQLKLAGEIRQLKKRVFDHYEAVLPKSCQQQVDPSTSHSQWIFGVKIPGAKYSQIQDFYQQKGVDVRPMFHPISRHSHLNEVSVSKEQQCLHQELQDQWVMLPTYPDLTEREYHYIAEITNQLINKN